MRCWNYAGVLPYTGKLASRRKRSEYSAEGLKLKRRITRSSRLKSEGLSQLFKIPSSTSFNLAAQVAAQWGDLHAGSQQCSKKGEEWLSNFLLTLGTFQHFHISRARIYFLLTNSKSCLKKIAAWFLKTFRHCGSRMAGAFASQPIVVMETFLYQVLKLRRRIVCEMKAP